MNTDRTGCDLNRATGRGQRARSSAIGARRQVPRPHDGADGNSALVPAAAAERMKENIWPR
jgi:hypothetical protein